MIDVTTAVENDFRDALLERTFRDLGTDSFRCLDVAAVVLESLVLGAGRDERDALRVVDDLRIDVCEAAIDIEARALGGACDMVADPQMTFLAGLVLVCFQKHYGHSFLS